MISTIPLTFTESMKPVTAEYSLAETELGAPIALMGIPFDNVTREQTLAIIQRMIASRAPHYIATANVDFLVQAQTDVELRRILFDAHLVLCDGTPLLWASRWLGNPLAERVAGSDLVPLLLEAASRLDYSVFILGAAEEMNERAVSNIRAQYPSLNVAGRYSPPPAPLQEMNHDEIRRRIKEANPDILLVAFGCPKQEKWISMHYRELGVPVCVGVGATVDFLAGAVKRAPVWMRKAGLEWTWRLAQEPRRLFGRYMKDFGVFGCGIIRQLWSTRTRKSGRSPEALQAVPLANDVRVLVLPERLDAAAVQQYRDHWEDQIMDGTLVVDLTATTFIDSTGVGFLMRLRRLAREKNAPFALVGVTAAVSRNIALMKLSEFFPISPTVDAAWQIAQDAMNHSSGANATADGIALHLQGEITEANADESFKYCDEWVRKFAFKKKVSVDLSQVGFVDSAGISVLVRLRKWVRATGGEIEMTNPTPAVENVLRVSGLAALLLNGGACKSA